MGEDIRNKAQVILGDPRRLIETALGMNYAGPCPICGNPLLVDEQNGTPHTCGSTFTLKPLEKGWALEF